MKSARPCVAASLAAALLTAMLTPLAQAQTYKEKVLYSFTGGTNGANPLAGLIFDSSGNLYGTANDDDYNCGTVFKLTPEPKGRWEQSVLHAFTCGKDGGWPFTGLIFDSKGNLYGSTSYGGNLNCGGNGAGCGVVFELTPTSHGNWQEKVLYAFNDHADGGYPNGLTIDSHGNLYGTTSEGGHLDSCSPYGGCGVAFKLTRGSKGGWKESVIHTFSGGRDGATPGDSVIFDSRGNAYGTTTYGGDTSNQNCVVYNHLGCGVVFRLTHGGNGKWTEKILYTFRGSTDESFPSGLIFDERGNLYGPISQAVFELTPTSIGPWKKKVIHAFKDSEDGSGPHDLIFDSAGNLYSTTIYGGDLNCFDGYGCGVVFELTPASNGNWMEKVLYAFKGGGADGEAPRAGLVMDSTGGLYGTTEWGGLCDCGVVFKVTP